MTKLYKDILAIENYQSSKPLYKQIAEIKGMASTARYAYEHSLNLSIPKWVVEGLSGPLQSYPLRKQELFGYSLQNLSPEVEAWLFEDSRDVMIHRQTLLAYLNPLTRAFVEVED